MLIFHFRDDMRNLCATEMGLGHFLINLFIEWTPEIENKWCQLPGWVHFGWKGAGKKIMPTIALLRLIYEIKSTIQGTNYFMEGNLFSSNYLTNWLDFVINSTITIKAIMIPFYMLETPIEKLKNMQLWTKVSNISGGGQFIRKTFCLHTWHQTNSKSISFQFKTHHKPLSITPKMVWSTTEDISRKTAGHLHKYRMNTIYITEAFPRNFVSPRKSPFNLVGKSKQISRCFLPLGANWCDWVCKLKNELSKI